MTQNNENDIAPIEKRQKEIDPDIIKSIVFEQDVAKLSSKQLLEYVHRLCSDLGINPLAQPFQLLKLQGKTQLYATKNATDQLRHVFRISIVDLQEETTGDICIVTVKAEMPLPNGTVRYDMDTGIVNVKGLTGDVLANAKMKAGTKAKRRVTLSLTGLSNTMDETEVETVAGAETLELDMDTGEILKPSPENTQQDSKGHAVKQAQDRGAVVQQQIDEKQEDDFLREINQPETQPGEPQDDRHPTVVYALEWGNRNSVPPYTDYGRSILSQYAIPEPRACPKHDTPWFLRSPEPQSGKDYSPFWTCLERDDTTASGYCDSEKPQTIQIAQ
jgi:hypothetical protein